MSESERKKLKIQRKGKRKEYQEQVIENKKNLLTASLQGLKLGIEYLDHPSTRDIKKTGRVSIYVEGIVVIWAGIKRSYLHVYPPFPRTYT